MLQGECNRIVRCYPTFAPSLTLKPTSIASSALEIIASLREPSQEMLVRDAQSPLGLFHFSCTESNFLPMTRH